MKEKEKKTSILIKLMFFLIIALLFFFGWVFDFIYAKSFDIRCTYISNTAPYAREEDVVIFEIEVTKNGKPCKNHEIEVRCGENQGRFTSYLELTDDNGKVQFEYVPYYETMWQKAGPVEITVLDLSNSIFIEVNAEYKFNEIVLQSWRP